MRGRVTRLPPEFEGRPVIQGRGYPDLCEGLSRLEELQHQATHLAGLEVGETAAVGDLPVGDHLVAEPGEVGDVPVDVVGVGAQMHDALAVPLEELGLDALARHRLQQLELDIAHLADDPGLIQAFESGQDVHTSVAAQVFGIDPAAVGIEERSTAKMVSYGLAYGMEAYGLGQRLNISMS